MLGVLLGHLITFKPCDTRPFYIKTFENGAFRIVHIVPKLSNGKPIPKLLATEYRSEGLLLKNESHDNGKKEFDMVPVLIRGYQVAGPNKTFQCAIERDPDSGNILSCMVTFIDHANPKDRKKADTEHCRDKERSYKDFNADGHWDVQIENVVGDDDKVTRYVWENDTWIQKD